jgi:Ca2+-binding EF-hand superfamily protein
MRRVILGACYLMLTSVAEAQLCAPSMFSGMSGDLINISTDPGELSNVAQTAANQWMSSCPGAGTKYPVFTVNNNSFSAFAFQVSVAYHAGPSPGTCGSTHLYVPFPGGRPVGASIDLWATEFDGTPCVTSDSLAHELGHVLGLDDAPLPYSSCFGTIMGGHSPGGVRAITQDDCQTADANWTTTAEQPPLPPGGGGGSAPGPGDGGSGGTPTEALPCFPGVDCGVGASPIVINFEEGDYRLTGANAPVRFPMDPRAGPELMGWTAAGTDEAFLWLDRNHNGKVTSGAELFGNFTPLRNGQMAKNGFEALREFDDNHDGVIDKRDAIWTSLMLWRDLNHDGISESWEIAPLEGSGVIAIRLDDHQSGRRDAWGNAFRYESVVMMKNRSGHGVRNRPVYDIFFVRVDR